MNGTHVILTGDLHLHEWPIYGAIVPGEGQSRLLDGLGILDQISTYARQHKIVHGIFAGDVFHTHGQVIVNAAAGFTKWVLGEREEGRTWHFNIGNHDIDNAMALHHALEPFKPYLHVVDELQEVEIGGCRIIVVPWQREATELVLPEKQKAYSLVVGHFDLADVQYRGRFIGRAGSHKVFREVQGVSGHYHDRILVSPTFRYLGAPMQHDVSDRGRSRGFWDVELMPGKRPKFTFVRTRYPKFKRLTVEEVRDLYALRELHKTVEGNFVQLICGSKERDNQDALEALSKCNPRVVEPLPIVPIPERGVVEVDDTAELDLDEVVDEWVQEMAPSDLSPKRLRKFGKLALRGGRKAA